MRGDVMRLGARMFAALIVADLLMAVSATGPFHVQPANAAYWVRGIYRFSSTAWGTMASDGFNWSTDGGTNTNNYGGQRAAGLNGMVWLDAYSNSSCTQTMTDAEISSVVHTNVSGGNAGAVYQVGDEPTTNGCNAAPTYAHITGVIHGADSRAKSWVADDQFNDPNIAAWPAGLPMKGSVDILAFDIYPCQAGPCEFSMIDQAVRRIHSVGLRSWEFILQDFGPCQSWRAPTAAEVTQQFLHWYNQGALGYWVYALDTDPTPCPGNVTGAGELRTMNSMNVNYVAPPPAAAPPPQAPKPTPKPSAAASPVASPSPSANRPGAGTPGGASQTPAAAIQHAQSAFFSSSDALPIGIVAVGVLLALVGGGLFLARRRRSG